MTAPLASEPTTVAHVLRALEARYPFDRAEPWDNVGLVIGDARAPVSSTLVAHEVTEATLAEAIGYDALVVYHPPIFKPLDRLDCANPTVALAARCLQRHLHVICVHTALDNAPAPQAMGDELAREIGLENVSVLGATGAVVLFKLAVFTPPEALDRVSEALWEAGAGQIGHYDRASFRSRGTGTFRPLAGADPYSGTVGRLEEVDEWRLEAVVPASARAAALRAMIEAHPYEEVAYDLYPLENSTGAYGSARAGEPGSRCGAVDLDAYAAFVGAALRAPNLRLVRAGASARRVACVPGSGASYIEAAAKAGCDCLVTGDIKHHDALRARALGVSLIDVTHAATERAAIGLIATALSSLAGVKIAASRIDTNPFE